MSVIASLPMYDWPELKDATDALWGAIRTELEAVEIQAPETLLRQTRYGGEWRNPNLLLSQTCGWPYATTYRDALTLVAVPNYAATGCEAGRYSSAVIVAADAPYQRLDQLEGRHFAYNGPDSQSGVQTIREAIAPFANADGPFFGQTSQSGAHRASLHMVAVGEADCAAIDAICWHYAQHCEPEATSRLRVLCWTRPAPALPFVTARNRDAAAPALRAALERALARGAGEALDLISVAPPDEAAYLELIERVRLAPPLP